MCGYRQEYQCQDTPVIPLKCVFEHEVPLLCIKHSRNRNGITQKRLDAAMTLKKIPFLPCSFLEMVGLPKTFMISVLHYNFLCSTAHFHPALFLRSFCTYYNIFALSCSNAVLTMGILPKPWVSWMDFIDIHSHITTLIFMQMVACFQCRDVPTTYFVELC